MTPSVSHLLSASYLALNGDGASFVPASSLIYHAVEQQSGFFLFSAGLTNLHPMSLIGPRHVHLPQSIWYKGGKGRAFPDRLLPS